MASRSAPCIMPDPILRSVGCARTASLAMATRQAVAIDATQRVLIFTLFLQPARQSQLTGTFNISLQITCRPNGPATQDIRASAPGKCLPPPIGYRPVAAGKPASTISKDRWSARALDETVSLLLLSPNHQELRSRSPTPQLSDRDHFPALAATSRAPGRHRC